jgi:starch-binding outer membrane protein, SusD/RagB family
MSIFIFTSCDDELNLAPEDQLTLPVSFSNEQTALGVLNGAYSAAQQDDVLNGTPQAISDWMADNVDFVGSFPTFQEISEFDQLSDNTSIFAIWDDNYETIGATNLVIKFIPLVEDENFTDEERSTAVAEAKFLRALIYFNMANLFGQPYSVDGGSSLSVPLITEPFEGEVDFPSRATLEEVYSQVESDLMDAEAVLSDGNNTRANKGAAQALLSRLYLYKGEYAKAADYANRVIQSPAYALASNYEFYDTLSSEFVFTLVNTSADGQDSGQGFSGLYNPAPDGRGDAPFTDNLIAAYGGESTADKRFTELTQIGNDAEGNERYFTSKYPDGITNSDNAPVIRITEMYLTRAEANFREGTAVGDTPLNDINKLRARAGLAPLASIDSVDQILAERRLELAFEGHRRMDLLRVLKPLRRAGMPFVERSNPGDDKTIFPIPNREIDLNDNLVQNPGY